MVLVIIFVCFIGVIAYLIVNDLEKKERLALMSAPPKQPHDPFDHLNFPFDFPDGDPTFIAREAQAAIDEELAQEDHYQRKTKHESIVPPSY